MNMASLTLDGKTMDLARTFNYSQVISLYKNTKISTSRNDKDKISGRKPFKSEDEKGLTPSDRVLSNATTKKQGRSSRLKTLSVKKFQLRLLKILLRELK